MTEEKLRNIFEKSDVVCKVVEVRLSIERQQGYVDFPDAEALRNALLKNDIEFESRRLKIDIAERRKQPQQQEEKKTH